MEYIQYIAIGVCFISVYFLGYFKGFNDGKKAKIEIVSNYVGDKK